MIQIFELRSSIKFRENKNIITFVSPNILLSY